MFYLAIVMYVVLAQMLSASVLRWDVVLGLVGCSSLLFAMRLAVHSASVLVVYQQLDFFFECTVHSEVGEAQATCRQLCATGWLRVECGCCNNSRFT